MARIGHRYRYWNPLHLIGNIKPNGIQEEQLNILPSLIYKEKDMQCQHFRTLWCTKVDTVCSTSHTEQRQRKHSIAFLFFLILQPCYISTGVSNYDADKNRPFIDTLSPYPTAFSSNTSKKYFLTKLGFQKDYPCPIVAGTDYFRVGSDGSCSTPNCNGILPVGSTARSEPLLHHNALTLDLSWSTIVWIQCNQPKLCSSTISDLGMFLSTQRTKQLLRRVCGPTTSLFTLVRTSHLFSESTVFSKSEISMYLC